MLEGADCVMYLFKLTLIEAKHYSIHSLNSPNVLVRQGASEDSPSPPQTTLWGVGGEREARAQPSTKVAAVGTGADRCAGRREPRPGSSSLPGRASSRGVWGPETRGRTSVRTLPAFEERL